MAARFGVVAYAAVVVSANTPFHKITPDKQGKLCIDAPGGGASDGLTLWLWECNGMDDQSWVIDNHQIRFGPDESLCVDACGMREGDPLMLWECNSLPQQTWDYDDDAKRICISNTTMCVDWEEGNYNSGQSLHIRDRNMHANQHWVLWEDEGKITPDEEGKLCIDVPGGSASNGNTLWLWECNGMDEQSWVFDNHQIRYGPDESLCIDACGMGEGDPLMLWECNGLPQQTWDYDSDAKRICVSNTGMCIHWHEGHYDSGQYLHIWDRNTHTNQHWFLWDDCSHWFSEFAGLGQQACLILTTTLCLWTMCHLCSQDAALRRKIFWRQLLALTCTDLVSAVLHWVGQFHVNPLLAQAERTGDPYPSWNAFFWLFIDFVDFSSLIIEVQIAAGFAAACSGSQRCASTLRWTLPLGFAAAAGLTFLAHSQDEVLGRNRGNDGCSHWMSGEDVVWSYVAVSGCLLIAIFCIYGAVVSRVAPGPIGKRGFIRGMSYVMNAFITWVPYATVVNFMAGYRSWGFARQLANGAFFLNGAANASFYAFWLLRSRHLQGSIASETQLSDHESFVLDDYFNLDASQDAETIEATRLAAEAVAMVRMAEEGLDRNASELVQRKDSGDLREALASRRSSWSSWSSWSIR